MTTRQLLQVTEDYKHFVPEEWYAVTCETRWTTGAEDRAKLCCAVCECRIGEAERVKEITWLGTYESNEHALHHVKTIVCRNGVACRRRADSAY